MTKDQEWVSRAKGSRNGNRFFMWIISHAGLVPAYIFLFFAGIQYALCDKKSGGAIRDFRDRLGLKTSFFNLFSHFYTFGASLVDRYASLLSSKVLFKVTSYNEELLAAEAAKGKGVLLLGAHFGNWELAGNLLQNRINVPVNFLMYDAEDDQVKEILKNATEKRRFNIIFVTPDKPDTIIQIINALRAGEIVCLHGDRILDGQRNESIDFLGKKALFPIGPFTIASVSGAPVVPFIAVKTGMYSYMFKAFEPIYIERRATADQYRNAVGKYVAVLENVSRKYPLQWFNFYQFWGN